jgi:inhibitor of KinA sporulation pathway (predicted exonuclease)
MINLPDGDFVLADLEYTSWDGAMARDWGGPGEFREIVQIGAVKVTRAGGWHEVDALMVLVRPTLNPVLSDYFTNLTGITDADIARAGVMIWWSWKNAWKSRSTTRSPITTGAISTPGSAR